MFWAIGIGVVVALIFGKLIAKVLGKILGSKATGGSWKFWLILLGVSAAISMFATSIISVALITVIGIPIAMFLMAAPFLFFVVLGTWFLRRWAGWGLEPRWL